MRPITAVPAAMPALALALVLLPAAMAAQDAESIPRISVSGSAVIEAEPDRAVLNVAVETFAEAASEASQDNARKMTDLLAALRDMGIAGERVRTVSYSLQPEYRVIRPDDPRSQEVERRIVGYRALNIVRVVVDSVPRVGQVIDRAVARGGNRIAGLYFELSDPEPVRRQALQEASRSAREEARAVAEALGVGLGPVLHVSSSYAMPPPRPFAAMERAQDMMAAAPTTPIEGGTLQVRADVSVSFRILQP